MSRVIILTYVIHFHFALLLLFLADGRMLHWQNKLLRNRSNVNCMREQAIQHWSTVALPTTTSNWRMNVMFGWN